MSEALEDLMARLRAEYLAEIPSRLEEIQAAVEQLEGEDPDAIRQLTVLFHRLAGSAGAYGFGEVTTACRREQIALKAASHPVALAGQLREAVEEIRTAFAAAPTSPPIAP